MYVLGNWINGGESGLTELLYTKRSLVLPSRHSNKLPRHPRRKFRQADRWYTIGVDKQSRQKSNSLKTSGGLSRQSEK